MPKMDGDQLADRIRAGATARPPVLVAVTAMDDEEGRRRTAGFDLRLVKPVDPAHLLAAVTRLLRRPSAL